MQGRRSAGQQGSEPPEAHGDDEIAAAIRGGAPTGSRPVVKTGFDTNLPDDADDVSAGASAPIAAPRVGPDTQLIPGTERPARRPRWLGGRRRKPPAG